MPVPFTHLRSRAITLETSNIDTDQIIPARYMRTPRSQGYSGFLFYDLRFHDDGSPKVEFPLNQPENKQAKIIIAGANFGCGSSREAAVYALFDYGIRCIIAPSFGDIFRTNSYKNGLLLVDINEADLARLTSRDLANDDEFDIDLAQQTVRRGKLECGFSIESFWKECLLTGADDIDSTLRYRDQIASFAQDRFERFPWLARFSVRAS